MNVIYLRIACLLSLFVITCYAGETGRMQSEEIVTPKEHRRAPDQTFLTFPEWFLVYSPTEYAELVRTRQPSEFPFMEHTRQFWRSYGAIYQETKNKYPFNSEYHTMIGVIGVSTTLEYGLRAAYETLFGRITELTRRGPATPEEKLGAEVAREYVEFIRIEPWYKFDYVAKLQRLWSETSVWGPDLLRKWERKYVLTTEYLGKAIYAWLIKKGAQSSFDTPIPLTAVVTDRMPTGDPKNLPSLKVEQSLPGGAALLLAPRYQAFTGYAIALAKQGLEFREIAGNRSDILVTVLAPLNWKVPDAGSRLLFTQAISIDTTIKRFAVAVSIKSLAPLLNYLLEQNIQVEHIYDY